jgi:hypothetical protein
MFFFLLALLAFAHADDLMTLQRVFGKGGFESEKHLAEALPAEAKDGAKVWRNKQNQVCCVAKKSFQIIFDILDKNRDGKVLKRN